MRYLQLLGQSNGQKVFHSSFRVKRCSFSIDQWIDLPLLFETLYDTVGTRIQRWFDLGQIFFSQFPCLLFLEGLEKSVSMAILRGEPKVRNLTNFYFEIYSYTLNNRGASLWYIFSCGFYLGLSFDKHFSLIVPRCTL